MDSGHDASPGVGLEACSLTLSEKRDVWVLQSRFNAYHLGVGFCVNQTGKAITGCASDAPALLRILLVQEDPNGQVKRLMAEFLQVITQLLDA
jgi:hypothetical protein